MHTHSKIVGVPLVLMKIRNKLTDKIMDKYIYGTLHFIDHCIEYKYIVQAPLELSFCLLRRA